MTPEAQRNAIAEACGWKRYNGAALINFQWAPGHVCPAVPKWCRGNENSIDNPECPAMEVPDYLNDLNAIHQAEKILTLRQCLQMVYFLGRFENQDISHVPFSDRFSWHSTASQRAESILKTLNLWDDTK